MMQGVTPLHHTPVDSPYMKQSTARTVYQALWMLRKRFIRLIEFWCQNHHADTRITMHGAPDWLHQYSGKSKKKSNTLPMDQSHIKRRPIKTWIKKISIKYSSPMKFFVCAMVNRGIIFLYTPQPKIILDINHATRHGIFNLMHQCRKGIGFWYGHVRQHFAV